MLNIVVDAPDTTSNDIDLKVMQVLERPSISNLTNLITVSSMQRNPSEFGNIVADLNYPR